MKRLSLLIALMFCVSCSVLFAEATALQSFEGNPQDTWSFTAQPGENVASIWGSTDQNINSVSAHSGNWYWLAWLVSAQEVSLSFDPINLSPGYTYSLSFWYHSQNLNPANEYIRYCVEYDNGTQWTNWIDLNPHSNAWTQEQIQIPAYHNIVRLKVASSHSGITKYVRWDSLSIQSIPISPAAPEIYDISITQRCDGSKMVDIHYNIFDVNNDPATVTLQVSDNAGASFGIIPLLANLSGDIGDSISSGTGKHIVWNAGNEDFSLEGNLYRFRLLADDGTMYGTVATPVFHPPAGIYSSINVSISCATEGATIRYTIDGSEPNESSALYTAPIALAEPTILKTKAYKDLWNPSIVAIADYEIIPVPEGFVYVPGGTFTMGDTIGGGNSNQLPTHSVTLNCFNMGKYEIKQSEWQAVMGSNPAYDYGVGASYPVYFVSWYAILKYCNLRSIAEGLTPVYSVNGSTNPANWGNVPTSSNATWNAAICNWSANGYRLPTEAEWEYAARCATNTPDYLYSGSDDINAVAWYNGNSGSTSHPVGTKAPNDLGLYDMSGNVYEWCWDWYGSSYYGSSPASNPTGPASSSYRVLRGGNWYGLASMCRVSYRHSQYPYLIFSNLGFRLCRSAPVVASPVFNPEAGVYATQQTVSITCATDGARIYYTTDGSEPDESSALYTAPIALAENTILKAKGYKAGWNPGATTTGVYIINLGPPPPSNFVLVNGGTFSNGTSNVTLSSFYIDKYEVTQAGYQAVMGVNPSSFAGNPNRPVDQVSWFNAIEFCNRRSMQEGLTPCYSYSTYGTNPSNWPGGWNSDSNNHTNVSCNWIANGYRLPSEMEWMFAAKGGNQSQGYTYSGSNTIGAVAMYSANSEDRTWDVGGLAANECGTFDMSGNVWEWVWDINGNYPSGSQTNPTGASSGSSRMLRGGGWNFSASACTVSYRNFYIATFQSYVIGFRCVRRSP